MATVRELHRPVELIENEWVPLSDGTRLAAKIWLPEGATESPVPAIFEFLPYRKGDGTVIRDELRYPWFAAHGYAGVRVDLRGSGESDGILDDEYSPQELADAVETIAWIADQEWCTGSVGMTGISWGGFNALQVAALQPPALKAIITLCSTDDRYGDDVHYRGGAVEGLDMLPLVGLHADGQRAAARPGARRRALARHVAGADGGQRAAGRDLAGAPAARRLLEARLGVRGLLGDHLRRLRGRRLAGRLHERHPPAAREPLLPAQGADRPVGAQVPAHGHARARRSASCRSRCGSGTSG